MISRFADLAFVCRAQHHDCFHRLTAMRILRGDDTRLLNRGMLIHLRFDLGWPHLEARCVDHSLQAIDEEEITVVIDVTEIAGAEELLAVDFDEGRLRRLFIAPIAFEDLRTVRDDLAHLSGRHFLQRLRIDDARIGVEDRHNA